MSHPCKTALATSTVLCLASQRSNYMSVSAVIHAAARLLVLLVECLDSSCTGRGGNALFEKGFEGPNSPGHVSLMLPSAVVLSVMAQCLTVHGTICHSPYTRHRDACAVIQDRYP